MRLLWQKADTAITPINAASSMVVTKTQTGGPNPVTAAGQTLDYEITIENTGAVSLTGVTPVDTLPDGSAGVLAGPVGDTNGNSILDTSETWTYTISYTVTQSDIDAGLDLTNTASVTTNEIVVAESDTAITPINAASSMVVTKTQTGGPNPVTAAGQTLDYEITIENTGAVSLTGVTPVDTLPDGSAGVLAGPVGDTNGNSILDTNETWTYTISYTVTQSDIDAGLDLTNTASVTTNEIVVAESDTAITPINAASSMVVTKTQTGGPNPVTAAGQTLDYEITIENTGAVSLTGVTPVDTLPDGSAGVLAGPVGDTNGNSILDTNETWTYTISYTVTQSDIDAGLDLTNTASVTTNEIVVAESDTAITPINAASSMVVTKTQTGGPNPVTAAGQTLDYEITIENTGAVSLTGVTPVDTLPDGSAGVLAGPVGDTNGNSILDTNETWTYTISYTVTQSDIDAGLDLTNTASVTTNEIVVAESDTAITPINAASSMVVTKTQTGGPNPVTAAGQTLDYEITIENTGAVSLTGVTPVDTLPDGSAGVLAGPVGDTNGNSILDTNETWTYTISYTVTQSDIDAGLDLTNTASVTTNEIVVAESDTAITPINAASSMVVTKTQTGGPNPVTAAGQTLDYEITIENTGAVSLTGVTPVDTLPDGSAGVLAGPVGDTNGNSILDTNETWTYTISYTVTQSDIDAGLDLTNTASVTTNEIVVAESDTAITPINAASSMVVTKTQTGGPNPVTAAGQTLDYEITIENTGAVSLTGVTPVDTLPDGSAGVLAGPVGDTNGNSILDTNETWTYTISYTVTQSDIDAGLDLTNTASVTTNEIVVAESDTAITPINAASSMVVTKTQTGGPNPVTAAGQTLDYEITIENTGAVSLTGVTPVDTLPDGSAGVLAGPVSDVGILGAIDVGETWTYTISYAVTLADMISGADLINSASVTTNEIVVAETDTALTTVSSSDLEVSKVVDNATPNVGDNIVFTISVTNIGPSDATGVTVTDLIPNGYTYVSDDGTGAYVSGTGVWSVPAMTNGNTELLNITVSVNATGDYINIAEISTADLTDPDSTPGNGVTTEDDYSSIGTTPAAVSDLLMAKSVDNATPNVGTNVVFTLEVSNGGPSDATGVVVTDLLPTGYTYVSDDGAGAYVSGTGIWTVPAITNGNTATLNITATVNAAGVYTNIAEVTASDNFDPDSTPGNGVTTEDDYDSIGTTPAAVSDLLMIKSVDNATPNVGTNVVFTLEVSNGGPSDATGVIVTDLLPTGYTYVSDDGAGAYVSGTGIWTVPAITNGNTATLNITATVNAAGVYTNIAEVTASDNFDPDSTPGNGVTTEDDYSSIDTTPVPVSDIELSKVVDNNTPLVGSNVVFTLTVVNNGPSDATGVFVTDLLPTGYTYVSDDGTGAYVVGTGIWTVPTITNGNTQVLNITATVNAIGVYSNIAEVTASDNTDPDSTPGNGITTEDDYDSIGTTPAAVSDIELTKVVDNATPLVGSNVVFTLTVTNNGPSDATGVIVTDQLPTGYTYVSDDGTGAYVDGTGVWTVPTITNGNTQVLNITATVNATGVYSNIAEVTASDNTDPDSTPNDGVTTDDDYSSIDTTPVPVSDIGLAKVVDNATPLVGSNVVFTLTVANNGPSDATGVIVTDLLPTGYTYVSDDGTGAYVVGTGIWTVPTITNGNTQVLNITATVNATGVYTNIAEVTAADNTDPDSTPGNGVTTEDDYSSIGTTPTAVSDIELSKAVDNTTPLVGSNVVFTLEVSNGGPSDATGVVVTDLLPTGYTYVSDDGVGAYVSGTGIWTVPAITNGNTATLNITATVNATGVYTNIAEVTASDNLDLDSTPANGVTTEDDYDEIVTVPVAVSDIELTKIVDNATPFVGSNVIFTLTATNNGPSDATGVVVTDLLLTGYTYVSDDGTGAYVSGTGVWTIPVITNGNTATLNITATVNATGVYTNIAEVTASDNLDLDSTPGNGVITEDDYDEIATIPVPVSDVSITKIIDNATPLVGSTVTFTLTVSNDGPSDATGISVEDIVPDGYDTLTAITAGSTITGNTINWASLTVPSGSSTNLVFTARVLATGDYNNRAEIIASDNVDPDSDPNDSFADDDLTDGIADDDESIDLNVVPIAVSDIEISKTVDNSTPFVGSNVVFTITVTNNGLSDATGVIVNDLLPNGYSYVSDDSGGAYISGTGVWTIGDIANATSSVLNITALVNPVGDYLNVVEVMASDNFDPDSTPANGIIAEDDYDTVLTDPIPVSDVEISKSVDNLTPFVGTNVIFTVVVTNNGPSEATGVEVTDLLPTGYSYVSDDTGGDYVSGTGIWTVPNIASGLSETINITAFVLANGVAADYINYAEVTASDNVDFDSDPTISFGTDDIGDGLADDDEASVAVTPIPVSDMSLVKSVNDLNPTTGDVITFTLTVHNDGPSDATGIAIEDVIPDGYGNIINITNGGILAGNTIAWSGISVANGADVLLQFDAEVLTTGTNTTTSYYNQAEVTASDNIDFDSDFTESFDVDDDGDGDLLNDDDESILNTIIINFLPTAFDDNVFVVENSS